MRRFVGGRAVLALLAVSGMATAGHTVTGPEGGEAPAPTASAYQDFEASLTTRPPGFYEFGDRLYFVQEVVSDGWREEHVSQDLLRQETLNALRWVKRSQLKGRAVPGATPTPLLDEVVEKLQDRHLAAQVVRFSGTGRVLSKEIVGQKGRAIVVYPRAEAHGWIEGVRPLEEKEAREQVWKQLVAEEEYGLLRDLSEELERWDDYVAYAFRADAVEPARRTTAFAVEDPFLFARLTIRAFQRHDIEAGLDEHFRDSVAGMTPMGILVSALPRFPYAAREDIDALLVSLMDNEQNLGRKEFLESILRLSRSAAAIGAYAEAKQRQALAVHYAKLSGGFLPAPRASGETAWVGHARAEQDFLDGRRDRLKEIETGFLKSVQKAPNNKMAWLRLGETYVVMEQWSDALSALRMALTLDPESLETRSLLAQCYHQLGYTTLAASMEASVRERR